MTLYLLDKNVENISYSWLDKYNIFYSKLFKCYITYNEHIENNNILNFYIIKKIYFGDFLGINLSEYIKQLKHQYGYKI